MTMATVWHIFRREMGAYFTAPMAYVVMTLFLIITNIFFYVLLSQYVGQYAMFMMQGAPPDIDYNATQLIMVPMFYQMGVILLFLAPMVTMRLLAEENQLGTIEMLLTAPVRKIEVVLGKYLAAISVFAAILATTLVYPIYLAIQLHMKLPDPDGTSAAALLGGIEWGTVLMGYLGLLLLSSTFAAVGLFFSSLTENQIVAGALTFATLLFLWLMAALVNSDSVTTDVASFLREASIILRFEDFAQGVLNLGDALYYLSFTALGLFLTVNVLQARTS